VAIDEHELPVRQFPNEQRIGVTDLIEKSAQCGGLSFGMSPPVFWIRQQVLCRDTTQLADSISNLDAIVRTL
jgi:hypothetical protein